MFFLWKFHSYHCHLLRIGGIVTNTYWMGSFILDWHHTNQAAARPTQSKRYLSSIISFTKKTWKILCKFSFCMFLRTPMFNYVVKESPLVCHSPVWEPFRLPNRRMTLYLESKIILLFGSWITGNTTVSWSQTGES